MAESEGSEATPTLGGRVVPFPTARPGAEVTFRRDELRAILNLYGRMVAAGEWRDYAIDFSRDRAVFSVYRRASEMALFRIVKEPRLARRQGAYRVVNSAGMVMKRGHEIERVLGVLEPQLKLVPN